jgi:hypothetical protein
MIDIFPPPAKAPKPVYRKFSPGALFFRVINTKSKYPHTLFRFHGPFERFDHHREENLSDPVRAVCYCASSLSACIAETCGSSRFIHGNLDIINIEVTEELRLLDICGPNAMKAGTVSALSSTPDHEMSRKWASYFYLDTSIFGEIDGLVYFGAHNALECVVLWDRAISKVIEKSKLSITDPSMEKQIYEIADQNNLIVNI